MIGAHKSYDLYLGTSQYLKVNCKVPASGRITYFANGKEYEEDFFIDFENYITLFLVDSDYEDMLEIVKKQNSVLKEIKQSFDNLSINIIKIMYKNNGKSLTKINKNIY